MAAMAGIGGMKNVTGTNKAVASRGFGVIYAGPDDFAKFMVKSNTELGATMKAVGLVK